MLVSSYADRREIVNRIIMKHQGTQIPDGVLRDTYLIEGDARLRLTHYVKKTQHSTSAPETLDEVYAPSIRKAILVFASPSASLDICLSKKFEADHHLKALGYKELD